MTNLRKRNSCLLICFIYYSSMSASLSTFIKRRHLGVSILPSQTTSSHWQTNLGRTCYSSPSRILSCYSTDTLTNWEKTCIPPSLKSSPRSIIFSKKESKPTPAVVTRETCWVNWNWSSSSSKNFKINKSSIWLCFSLSHNSNFLYTLPFSWSTLWKSSLLTQLKVSPTVWSAASAYSGTREKKVNKWKKSWENPSKTCSLNPSLTLQQKFLRWSADSSHCGKIPINNCTTRLSKVSTSTRWVLSGCALKLAQRKSRRRKEKPLSISTTVMKRCWKWQLRIKGKS